MDKNFDKQKREVIEFLCSISDEFCMTTREIEVLVKTGKKELPCRVPIVFMQPGFGARCQVRFKNCMKNYDKEDIILKLAGFIKQYNQQKEKIKVKKTKKVNEIAVFLKENFPEIYSRPFSDEQLRLMERAKTAFTTPGIPIVQEKFQRGNGLSSLLLGIAIYFAVNSENRDIYFVCRDRRYCGVYADYVFESLLYSKHSDLLNGALNGGLMITLKNGCSLRFVFAGNCLPELDSRKRKGSFFIQDFDHFEYWKYPKGAIYTFYKKDIPGIIGI